MYSRKFRNWISPNEIELCFHNLSGVLFSCRDLQESKRQRIRGVDICDDIFDVHLQKGEKIEIGKPRPEKSYYAPYIGADSALLEVYTSTSGSPSFVTEDSCCLLGTLIVELTTEDTTREQIINVSFHYCGTELEVFLLITMPYVNLLIRDVMAFGS
jgi:hypothetical protein